MAQPLEEEWGEICITSLEFVEIARYMRDAEAANWMGDKDQAIYNMVKAIRRYESIKYEEHS